MVERIRHNTAIIPELPAHIREAAITSYVDALKAVFICQVVCHAMALLCCLPIRECPLVYVLPPVVWSRWRINSELIGSPLGTRWRSKVDCFTTREADEMSQLKPLYEPNRRQLLRKLLDPPCNLKQPHVVWNDKRKSSITVIEQSMNEEGSLNEP